MSQNKNQENQIERIACANENCGTFPMDVQLLRKLRETGETFTCPSGHTQHFSESLASKKEAEINALKKKLDNLEKRMERYRNSEQEAWDRYKEESNRRQTVEKVLLSQVTGVVEVGPDEFKWSCSCGSHGRESYDTPEEARKRFKSHQRRNDCENGITEAVIQS